MSSSCFYNMMNDKWVTCGDMGGYMINEFLVLLWEDQW
jgi:hypothetical protein